MEDSLRFLLILILFLSGLSAVHLARRMFRGNLPAIIELAALMVVAALGIFLEGDTAILLSIIAIGVGMSISTFPAVFENASTVARLREQSGMATFFAGAGVLLFPSLHRRRVYSLNRIAHRTRKGKMEVTEAVRLLESRGHEPATTDRVSLYHEVLTSMLAEKGRHEEVARMFPGVLQVIESGSPASVIGLIPQLIESLCLTERVGVAVTLSERLFLAVEGRAAALTSGLEIQYQRGVATFLAYMGRFASVEHALARTSTLRATFSRAHRQRLLTRAKNATVPAALEGHEQLIKQLEARLALASQLPSDFALLRSSLWGARMLGLVLIGTFAASAYLGSTLDPLHLARVGALSAHLVNDGQWWRLVSHGFLHAGIIHIAFNLFAIFLFGNMVERFLGTPAFLFIFLVSVVIGGEAARVFGDAPVLVGASGGAFGLFGAAMLCLWYLKDKLPQRWYRRNMGAFITLALFNFYIGIGVEFISLSAHVGGFLGGAFVAAGLLLALRGGERVLGTVSLVLAITAWVAAAVFTIPPLVQAYSMPATQLFEWSRRELPQEPTDTLPKARVSVAMPTLLLPENSEAPPSSDPMMVETPVGGFSIMVVGCRGKQSGAGADNEQVQMEEMLSTLTPGTHEELAVYLGFDETENTWFSELPDEWVTIVDGVQEERHVVNMARLLERGLILVRGNFDEEASPDWRGVMMKAVNSIKIQSCEL